MVIECGQQKVKRVRVIGRPMIFAATSALATVPVVKPIIDHDCIDPFAAYYRASREPRVHGPHHAFANLVSEDSVSPFFERFGFPYFHGRELLLGEVLIEAKRLRLLMEAWGAFTTAKLDAAQQALAELAFARGHQAHWYYWPPPLLPDAREEDREAALVTRQFLEAEFKASTESSGAVRRGKQELYRELVTATAHVCVSPLTQVEFAPEIEPRESGVALRWSLRPVRFLGEEERDRELYIYEEPYVAAPYGLMFLLDLSRGNETRVCAEPFCRQVFGASRRNQVFCSPSCAHRTAVRNSRRRQRST